MLLLLLLCFLYFANNIHFNHFRYCVFFYDDDFAVALFEFTVIYGLFSSNALQRSKSNDNSIDSHGNNGKIFRLSIQTFLLLLFFGFCFYFIFINLSVDKVDPAKRSV